jgi:hypothetical protein
MHFSSMLMVIGVGKGRERSNLRDWKLNNTLHTWIAWQERGITYAVAGKGSGTGLWMIDSTLIHLHTSPQGGEA